MVTSRGYSRKNKVHHSKSLTAYLKQQYGIQSTDIKPDGITTHTFMTQPIHIRMYKLLAEQAVLRQFFQPLTTVNKEFHVDV